MRCEVCQRNYDTDFDWCDHLEELNYIVQLESDGYRLQKKEPKTIFIDYNVVPNFSMQQLRDEFGWMIQTEIPV